MEELIGFDAILPKNAKVLILGSMPSVVSLDKQEYYGFPHNRFWKIMSIYANRTFQNYDDKVSFLLDNNIAVWDVIYSCVREGSLDSNIKNVQCNRIDELLNENQSIRYILCNGKKSYQLLMRYFPQFKDITISLGSTSNANRSVKEEQLIEEWISTLQRVLEVNE